MRFLIYLTVIATIGIVYADEEEVNLENVNDDVDQVREKRQMLGLGNQGFAAAPDFYGHSAMLNPMYGPHHMSPFNGPRGMPGMPGGGILGSLLNPMHMLSSLMGARAAQQYQKQMLSPLAHDLHGNPYHQGAGMHHDIDIASLAAPGQQFPDFSEMPDHYGRNSEPVVSYILTAPARHLKYYW